MHQLFLLRHAKAQRASATITDHDRPLLPEGRQAASGVGLAMRKAGLAPDVVLVSSALRTQQTLECLEQAGVWDERPNIDILPGLYMANHNQIREIVRDLPETVRSVIVIGHNPGLHDAALELAGAAVQKPEFTRLADGYPTASLSEFLVISPWRRLAEPSAALQRHWRAAELV